MLDRFKIGSKIGQGGFGSVFRAIRIADGRELALKVLPENCPVEDRKRFAREVRMQSLLRHANVVPIVEHDADGAPPSLTMPLAEASLEVLLQKGLSEKEALSLFMDALKGLDHAHANGVIHRDFKPENILVYSDGEGARFGAVGDFGLGRFVNRDTASITLTGIGAGTFGYVAPEQFDNAKHVDHRADVYSAGRVLYRIVAKEIPAHELDPTKIPKRYGYIVRKCCAKDANFRYPHVGAVLRDLAFVNEDLQAEAVKIAEALSAMTTKKDFSPEAVGNLAKMLEGAVENQEVLTELFPKLPTAALRALHESEPERFSSLLSAYDEAVDGSLPFSYCDVVAQFYSRIFAMTESFEVRERILRRLATIGPNHNRWHVGGVFAGLLARIDDESLALVIRELFEDDSVRDWNLNYIDDASLKGKIRDVVRDARKVEN